MQEGKEAGEGRERGKEVREQEQGERRRKDQEWQSGGGVCGEGLRLGGWAYEVDWLARADEAFYSEPAAERVVVKGGGGGAQGGLLVGGGDGKQVGVNVVADGEAEERRVRGASEGGEDNGPTKEAKETYYRGKRGNEEERLVLAWREISFELVYQVGILTSLDELAKTQYYRTRVPSTIPPPQPRVPSSSPLQASLPQAGTVPPPQPPPMPPRQFDSSRSEGVHASGGLGGGVGGGLMRTGTSWLSTVAGISPFLVKETHVSMLETSLPRAAHLAGGVHDAAHPPPQTPALLAAAERRRRHEVWSAVYTKEGPQVWALKPADMKRFVPEVGSGEGVRINDAVCRRLGYYPHFNPVLAHALLQGAGATRVAGAGSGAGGHIGEGECQDASSTSTSMRAALTAYYTPGKSMVFGGAVRTELGCAEAGMREGGGGAGDVHLQVQQERETTFDLRTHSIENTFAFQTLFQANVRRQGWSLQEGGGGGGVGGGGGTLPRKEPLFPGNVKREGWSLQENLSSSLLHSGAGRRDCGEGIKVEAYHASPIPCHEGVGAECPPGRVGGTVRGWSLTEGPPGTPNFDMGGGKRFLHAGKAQMDVYRRSMDVERLIGEP